LSKAFLCCADRVLVSLAVTPRLSYINKHSQLWLTVEVEHARACCHPSPFKGPSFAAAAAWPPVPPLVRLGTTSNSRPAWLCWQPKLSLFLIGHMCVTQVSITPRDGGRNPLPKLHTTHPTPPPGFLCTPSNTALPLLCTTQARATQANHNAVAHGCLLLAIYYCSRQQHGYCRVGLHPDHTSYDNLCASWSQVGLKRNVITCVVLGTRVHGSTCTSGSDAATPCSNSSSSRHVHMHHTHHPQPTPHPPSKVSSTSTIKVSNSMCTYTRPLHHVDSQPAPGGMRLVHNPSK
jgi:hypothetical protein